MTEATVTTRLEVNDPTKEVVVLTATDTETYISKKFATVVAAQATFMEDTTTISIPISLDVSSQTVTFNCTGITDKKVCLTLYGRK